MSASAADVTEFDVIVVGAGVGGASCAAVLAARGHQVALVDRNQIPGGKAMTVRAGGFGYELWPVISGPSVGSRFEELLREIDAEGAVEMLTPTGIMEFVYAGDRSTAERRRMVGSANPGGGDPMGLINLLDLTEQDIPELLRMTTDMAAVDDAELARLEGTTFSAWLDQYELPTSVRSWFGIQSNIIFVVAVDELDAAEAIRTLRDFGQGAAGRYHAGGYGRIAEVCCDTVTRHGGSVILGTGVSRIIVADDRVTGVELVDGRTLNAPVVVSNAGIQPTVLKLVGGSHFAEEYVKEVSALRPSRGIIGKRYEMNGAFFERGAYFSFADDNYLTVERFEALRDGELPEELAVFAVIPSVYDPSLAPEGRQMVLASTFCDPDVDLPHQDLIIERLDEAMERVWPGFGDAVRSSVAYGTKQVSLVSRDAVVPGQGGECIGLGQIAGQCGTSKPSPVAPLSGLYYVGCDAGGYGCGTHQAVDSGLNLAELLST